MPRFKSKTLTKDAAIFASSDGEGVRGETTSSSRFVVADRLFAGVVGTATEKSACPGVIGISNGSGPGVLGQSHKEDGVVGFSGDPKLQETTVGNIGVGGRAGVFGASETGPGITGYARDPAMPAVFAFGGLRALAMGRPFAGEFNGNVKVIGDILLAGADCAEQFDIADGVAIAPGEVVVIGEDGTLRQCHREYDTKVAGVVAGAGTYRPGIVLDSQEGASQRPSISLVGKVFCKVDSQYAPIAVGDLLTSSLTPGHAMKVMDPSRAFGAIIGKALKPWRDGIGLIPILVALG